jgi:cyclic beta-1,2-glucan synthetase
VPWGISESAHGARDGAMRYQYCAFGVPAVSLKRQAAEEPVTAPYASALALMVDSNAAADNLRRMAEAGSRGRYGMYEAVDHAGGGTVVRCFMAHHEAMTLLSLANVLLDGAVRKRFHAEPMVQATEYLLGERLPALLEIAADEDRFAAPSSAALQAASPLRGT